MDLNRNFPYRWADLDGSYESGREPASEPETRALMRFFKQVRPRYVVSFHQPLNGVDVSVRSVRRFADRLATGSTCRASGSPAAASATARSPSGTTTASTARP